jgi:GNAT superfamily N-acetyltransferase
LNALNGSLRTSSKAVVKIEIIFEPNISHLNQLEVWLKDEYENCGDGFYCNWNVIKRSFDKRQMYCAVVGNEVAGLLVWWKSGTSGGIDILEVHPSLRRKGIGQSLVEASLGKFVKEGVSCVYLECQPPASEPFWRRLGFRDDLEDKSQQKSDVSLSVKLYRLIF